MPYLLLIPIFILAILDWIAVAKGWKKAEYVLKPATMLALLAWLGVVAGFSGSLIWFGLGLLFSLAGDVFLMLPREKFIPGLVAFLLAHLAYLVGLNQTTPPFVVPSLIMAILVAITSLQVYRRISQGLKKSGRGKLAAPVMVYTIVISLMLLSALLTLVRPEWNAVPALLVSAGALLFYFSDTLLAWNKFVAPLPIIYPAVMITYHLGQILIIVGAATQFGTL
jgi:uncharacterized membrane protein YhhN